MEPRCTCGAVLPEDARFCHKCGKPQYQADIERLSEPVSAPVQAPLDVPGQEKKITPIGFGNARAVTITIAVAAISLLPLALSMLAAPLGLVVLCVAGYFAANLYRKQTSQPLSTGGGAYLGLMTGLWLFLVFALSAAALAVEVNSPAGRAALQAAMAKMPQGAQMPDDPHQLLVSLFELLIPTFFLVTLSSAFGGMLAARRAARRPQV